MTYMYRNTAITFFCIGLLVGMIVGMAACAPEQSAGHVTTIGTK